MVNFIHIAALGLVEASKLYVRATKHKVNTYYEYLNQSESCVLFQVSRSTSLIHFVHVIYVNNTLPLALAVQEISRHFRAAYGRSTEVHRSK